MAENLCNQIGAGHIHHNWWSNQADADNGGERTYTSGTGKDGKSEELSSDKQCC